MQKTRGNDIVTIAVHTGNNRFLTDKMRAATTERGKGALIMDRLKQLFGFASYDEVDLLVAVELEKERERNEKIIWERDRFGNPTSPRRATFK